MYVRLLRSGCFAAALVSSSLGALGSAGCANHVRLVVPGTTTGARYSCHKDNSSCTKATRDVPADANKSGTAFVILPEQCKGRYNEILVLDADSSSPSVEVTCAPLENAPDEVME